MLYRSVIMAADEKQEVFRQSRFLLKAADRPLIDWALDAAKTAGAENCTVVTGARGDAIKAHLGDAADYAAANDAFSIASVLDGIPKGQTGSVLVLFGDRPTLTGETLRAALTVHEKKQCVATVICAAKTVGFTETEMEVASCAAAYLFDIGALRRICRDAAQSAKAECPFAAAVQHLLQNGEAAEIYPADQEEGIAVTDRILFAKADAILNRRTVHELMRRGAIVLNPDSVRAAYGATVGMDTVIYPGTILEGETEIGEECVIGPNTRLKNAKVGDRTEIQSSVVLDSKIGSDTSVGPFAYIRPGSVIGSGNKVGDFVEVKNATIGDGTKIAHLTYVGDADVGERVNFGCGTVVVNYDGIKKHRTVIEDDCFIGCNSNLVSPVTLRKGAYTAAGSTITDEVPEDALAIARARQVNKDGWVKKNRRKDS